MENTSQKDKNIRFLSISIIVASVIISGTIFYNSSAGKNIADSGKTIAGQQQENNQVSDFTKVSVDDDPVLGDKNAPLTLIEFSDYECPFCKRSFDQVLTELKKNYIDTGKVKLVFRDLPLSFHANAHKEAQAAECVRDQGGDETYFKYHDQIFERTTSNGTGLALNQLPVIAKSLNLDVAVFQQCLDSNKYKAEVDNDLADAARVGASGTPTYFIGQSSNDGIINGKVIIGAQPFSAFKAVIDELL